MNELQELKGIYGLNTQERNYKISKMVEQGLLPKNWTMSQVDRIFRNNQYVDTFGIEAFKANTDPISRDKEFKSFIVGNAVKSKYANDPNLEGILKMTTEGQLELLNNNKYNTQDFINQSAEDAKNSLDSNFTGPGMMPIYSTIDKSEEKRADLLNENNEILNSVYTKDLERKKQSLSPIIQETEQSLLEAVQSGEYSIEAIKKDFDNITQGTHYEQLKNSTTFKDFNDADLIREYATFLAMYKGIDPNTAFQTIRADMQNYTNEHMPIMDWSDAFTLLKMREVGPESLKEYQRENPTVFRNAKRDAITTAGAYFGKVPVAIEGIIKSTYQDEGEAKDLWLQGLDADGNPLPIWRNPLYWQGVEQYNSWDTSLISHLQETGGASPYVNVPQAGDELEFWNGINILNAATQAAGQALPMVGMAVISGGASSAAQAAGSVASKLAWGFLNAATTAAEIGIPALTMSHGEAYEVYQNTNLAIQQEIDAKIDNAVKAEMERLYNSEEGKQDIQRIKNLLISQAAEQGQFYSDEEYLNELASQKYLESLQHTLGLKYKKEFNDREKEGREEAARIAYNTTFGIHTIKNVLFDIALNRVFMSKGTRDFFNDNSLLRFKPKEYIDEAGNKVFKELSRSEKFANALIEGGKQFADEWSDAVVNSLGENIGLNDYNDFVKKTYNQESYVETMDNWFNHFIMGLNDLPDDMFTREALYEGWAGLISSFVPGINPDIFTSQGLGKSFRTDEYDNKLSFMESVNKYITNPLLGAYYEYNPQERAAKARIDMAAQILADNKDKLEIISRLMTASGETDDAASSKSLRETIDAKHNELVQAAMMLEELEDIGLTGLRQEYQNVDGLAQSIIEDTISEEEKNKLIDSYLNRSDNKSVANNTPEEAWAQIQENARKFSKIRETIKSRKAFLDKNSSTKHLSNDVKRQLISLELQNENLQERISGIKKDLKLPDLGTRAVRYNYGARFGNKNKLELRQQVLEESSKTNKDNINKNKEALKEAKKEYKKARSKEDKQKVYEKIQALELEQKVLQTEERDIIAERSDLYNSIQDFKEDGYSRTLSKEEILSLEIEDMVEILNLDNLNNYSPEQQDIIIQTRIELNQKDINAQEKIKDLEILTKRRQHNSGTWNTILENPEALELYTKKKIARRLTELNKAKTISSAKYLSELIDKENTDSGKIEIAKGFSVNTVKYFIETYPEYKDLLEPILPLVQFHNDLAKIINDRYGKAKSSRGELVPFINDALKANTVEEAMSNFENAIDKAIDPKHKLALEEIVQKLEEIKYQRDATKVQSRKERQEAKKRAEQEEAKRLEEEQKRKEEKLKKAKEELEKESPTPTVEQFEEAPKEDIVLEGEETSKQKEVIIEDSNKETQEQPKEVIVTPSKKVNTLEDIENDNPVSLYGNRVVRYDLTALSQEGIQVPLQGKEENDRMNKVFNWLDSLGSNYQDVIDHELTRILKANPKIQLMMTWDKDADDEIFEVVEYTDKVKNIHSEDKGGIIQSNGKRYLIIGRLGYNRNNDSQYNSYINIKDALKIERGTLRKNDPTARFMVSEIYHTEVENMSEGYITRALVGEDVSLRTLEELISDPKRNPRGIPSINDLSWGIVTPEGMLLIKAGRKEVAELKNSEKNIGNVFLLVESANGTYIPVYMRPQRYNNLRESNLKSEIDNAINELTSPNYEDRQKALEFLSQRLVLNPNDNYIINNAEGNTITIKKEGIIIKSFKLDDPNFSRAELIDAVKSLNARVNVNKDIFNDNYLLEQYDEAGALVTDIAKLATTNAIFSVYSMNSDGNPIIPKIPNPTEARPVSDFNRKQEQTILYLDKFYRKVNGEFRDENNHAITDPITIEQLKLLERVKQMTPVLSKGGYDFYVLNSDPNNPSACKVHTKSNKITMANKEQSLKLLNDMKEAQIREEQIKALEQVQLPEQQEITNSYEEAIKPKEDIQETSEKREESVIKPISLVQELDSKESYTFEDILYDSDNAYGDSLMEILEEKKEKDWQDIPLEGNVEELSSYLESKGVSTIGIKNIDSWLQQVKDCL